MIVNLKNVGLFPEGFYQGKLVNYEETTINNKLCVNCEFELTESGFEGKKINDTIYLTENALWRLKDFALAVNFEGSNSEKVETRDIFKFAMEKTLRIKIIQEPYTGKDGKERKSNKVATFESLYTEDPTF